MDIAFVAPDLRRLDKIRHEALAAALFEGEWPLRGALGLLDWRLAGRVSRMIQQGIATGERGESLLIPGESKVAFDKLFLRGAGAAKDFDAQAFDEALEAMLDTLTRAGVRSSAHTARSTRRKNRYSSTRRHSLRIVRSCSDTGTGAYRRPTAAGGRPRPRACASGALRTPRTPSGCCRS